MVSHHRHRDPQTLMNLLQDYFQPLVMNQSFIYNAFLLFFRLNENIWQFSDMFPRYPFVWHPCGLEVCLSSSKQVITAIGILPLFKK